MKRQPESAYRLRASSTSSSSTSPSIVVEGQERRRQQSQWNGNLQGATNDSAEYRPAVRIVDGYPVEYSCRDDPRENNIDDSDLKFMDIEFDYEMITGESADPDGSIRSLEWSLLWNVAQVLGLHNCNFRKQDPSFDDRRLQSTASPTQSYIVSLSSLDFDEVDRNTDFCTFLKGDSSSNNGGNGATVCTPVVGKMTAHYIGDEETIRNYLTTNIAKEMNSNRVRIEDVQEARFVGDRDSLAVNASVLEGLDSKNNSSNLALVVGVLAGVVVLVFALFMARGTRRQQQQQEDVSDDGDQSVTPSVPNVIIHKQQQEQHNLIEPSNSRDSEASNHERREDVEDSSTVKQSEDSAPPPVNIVTSVIATSQNLDVQRVDATETNTLNTLPTENGEDKENTGVPPRPPVFVVPVDEKKEKDTVKSKTLQTRRKRKKKKKQKQRVLKRISSRNSIDEMETIREDPEGDIDHGSEFDGSDYGSEYGSEYSTDDEDDGMLILNITTTDAPQAASPKASPQVIPPSPIREEPKIRRLPPPWI